MTDRPHEPPREPDDEPGAAPRDAFAELPDPESDLLDDGGTAGSGATEEAGGSGRAPADEGGPPDAASDEERFRSMRRPEPPRRGPSDAGPDADRAVVTDDTGESRAEDARPADAGGGGAGAADHGAAGDDPFQAMRRPEPPLRGPRATPDPSAARAPLADGGDPDDAAADEDGLPMERPGGLLSRVDHHVVLYHDPHGLQAEQYRQCRTNLTALNRSGAPFVVVISSSRKGEGKSVSAANLAVCLAEVPGARVCLVDADCRSPSQAELFGSPGPAGLTDVLAGRASLDDALARTLIPGLDLIPAGTESPNPAEDLGGPRYGELMDALRRRYSWIVVDTPPVHPFTDACVMARRANGVLIVVRLLETPRHLVNTTVESVQNAGGTVLGTFITGLTPDRDDEEDVSFYPADVGAETAAGVRSARKQRRRVQRAQERKERSILKQQGRRDKDDDRHPV